MSLSFKKTCNVAIASAAVGLAQHFAGKELHQGPYLVKQVGALNMKLQMQLASKGSAVAKGSYPNVKGMQVISHSYFGDQKVGNQYPNVRHRNPSDASVVVLDPAGIPFMTQEYSGSGATSAAGQIYNFLGRDGVFGTIPLPLEASQNLKQAGDAHYVAYKKESGVTKELSVVHTIGPDARTRLDGSSEYPDNKTGRASFVRDLLSAYSKAFSEFSTHAKGKTEFWILPVSSGIFSPHWLKRGEVAMMTAVLVREAIRRSGVKEEAVKMHIFDQSEVRDFEIAFKNMNPAFTIDDTEYDRDNLKSLVLEAESGVEVLVVAETQPDCPELKTVVASEHSLGGGVVKDCPQYKPDAILAAHDVTAAGIKLADVTAAGIKSVQPGRKSSELVQRRRKSIFSCCASRRRHVE